MSDPTATCPQCASPFLWIVHMFDIVTPHGYAARMFCRACGCGAEGEIEEEKVCATQTPQS